MTRYNGGTKVAGGYYLNLTSWEFQAVEGDAGVLPGSDVFLHLPGLLVLPAAIILSFVFVVFLPFIGFALAAYALARKVGAMSHSGARSLAATVAPPVRPGLAYFAGEAKKDGEAQISPPAGEKLEALEREVEARRETEEKK
jgi:hypothetical protein